MATKKAAKKPAAKSAKTAPKAAPKAMKPIKEALGKSALVAHIAEYTGVAAKDVRNVIAALESTVQALSLIHI